MPVDDAMNTPAMKQFIEIKKKYEDSILFFRMGDFYEMFGEDAIIASSILDIALTKRQNQIPMCGIPYHASENYLSRLINAGKRVVICEQSKNNDGNTKLLQREVVRVLSPGTIVEENLIGGFENNYLSLIHFHKEKVGVCFLDISTSDFYHSEFHKSEKVNIISFYKKFNPKEILVYKENAISFDMLEIDTVATITYLDSTQISIPPGSGNQELKEILNLFLSKSIKDNKIYLSNPLDILQSDYLEIDSNTIKNLELTENQSNGDKNKTLFSVLNKCITGSGKRLLKKRILFPFTNEEKIMNTRKKINIFLEYRIIHSSTKELLKEVPDLERIINRFKISKKAYPRDFRAILNSIDIIFKSKELLSTTDYEFKIPQEKLIELQDYIQSRLFEGELPALLGGDGNFLKSGFSKELDNAREAKSRGKDWIIDLEQREKKLTSLSTLKIRYNKIVGYFIELSRKDSELAPKSYFKKQTLVTSERFTCPELEELERNILSADDIINEIESLEFNKMIEKIIENFTILMEISNLFSDLDYHSSMAECKIQYNWIFADINHNGELILENSRHPVVENYLPSSTNFISNSIDLNSSNNAIAILTGPNMAGKSTFMKQLALIQILFQMGSAVPASRADLSICDKVFTRIGSGDNITSGESTFYIEMKESAHILLNRTEKSLILFDEIGRGTSTYDGLSLAWAILENLSRDTIEGKRSKTIFATHYHELTELEKETGIFNIYMDTREKNGEVVFLKKVKIGRAKKSFGIYVAKLAGIPSSIVDRSAEILSQLESKKREVKIKNEDEPNLFTFPKQISEENTINKFLENINPDNITPKEALDLLYQLKKLSSR